MRPRREHVLIGAGVIAAGVSAWWRDQEHLVPATIFYYACYLPLNVIAWWAALRLRRPGQRAPWLMLAAFETSWLTGDLLFDLRDWFFPTGLPAEMLPWLAQAAYWLGYVAIFTMLLMMVRRRAPGQLRAGVLDGLTLATALGLVVWQFLVLPQVLAPDFDVKQLGFAMYPVADVVVIAGALLLGLAPGRRGMATKLLVCAVLVVTINDLGINVIYMFAPDHVERMAAVALLSNVLMVAVSLHRNSDELITPAREARRLHPARVVFLSFALLTAPAMSLSTTGSSWAGERPLLVAGAVVISALIMARFVAAVRAQERIRAELHYQASHDALTGLINRRTMADHLHHYLTTGDKHAILLYVDLDGFKAVNDEAGHEAGDAVLVEFGRRLTAAVRQTDLVARLGGDEFAILCPGTIPLDIATGLAQRILGSLDTPIAYAGQEHRVGASIGIAVPTPLELADVDDDARVDHLLRTADHAMFEAKRLGKGRWVVATDDPHGGVVTPSTRAADLAAARTAPVQRSR